MEPGSSRVATCYVADLPHLLKSDVAGLDHSVAMAKSSGIEKTYIDDGGWFFTGNGILSRNKFIQASIEGSSLMLPQGILLFHSLTEIERVACYVACYYGTTIRMFLPRIELTTNNTRLISSIIKSRPIKPGQWAEFSQFRSVSMSHGDFWKLSQSVPYGKKIEVLCGAEASGKKSDGNTLAYENLSTAGYEFLSDARNIAECNLSLSPTSMTRLFMGAPWPLEHALFRNRITVPDLNLDSSRYTDACILAMLAVCGRSQKAIMKYEKACSKPPCHIRIFRRLAINRELRKTVLAINRLYRKMVNGGESARISREYCVELLTNRGFSKNDADKLARLASKAEFVALMECGINGSVSPAALMLVTNVRRTVREKVLDFLTSLL